MADTYTIEYKCRMCNETFGTLNAQRKGFTWKRSDGILVYPAHQIERIDIDVVEGKINGV